MWNPSFFFISNRLFNTQNNFGPLNDHIITEFSWVVTMGPAVPSTDILRWPVTSQWPSSWRLKLWRICYIRQHKINPRALWYEQVVKMTQIAHSGLFWTQFRMSRDVFTDLTARKATVRTFLPRLLTAASRIQNCTHRKIITYQTAQSNLPNASMFYTKTPWILSNMRKVSFKFHKLDIAGLKGRFVIVVNCTHDLYR